MKGKPDRISYDELRNRVERLLKRKKHMVLATCANDRVTARTMSCVSDGLTVYCQTDKTLTKCRQIAKNPNVALCAGNVQVEGTASILGHPFSEANGRFAELFKRKHPGSFKRYSHLEDEIVIKIKPIRVTLWIYDVLKGTSYRDTLNVVDETTHREYNDG